MSTNKKPLQRIDTMTLKCARCAQGLTNKEHIKCSICNSTLHLECTNITIKRFLLMSKQSKDIWKCSQCLKPALVHAKRSKPSVGSKTQSQDVKTTYNCTPNKTVDNITLRKQNYHQMSLSSLQTSQSSLDRSLDSSFNNSAQSMPNTSEKGQISELKDTIEVLKTQLISAHEEITNLNQDITYLTKNQSDLERQIVALKSLLGDEAVSRKSIPQSSKKKSQMSGRKSLQKSRGTLLTTTQDKIPLPNPEGHQQNNIANLSVNSLSKPEDVTPKPNKINKCNKICIISSNKRCKILNAAENIFSNEYRICHYLLPNSGINELFANIHGKVNDLTLNDYCIILIGEEDFKETKDYFSLVKLIRKRLLHLNHTNFVICSPTYRYNVGTMYNWRIEKFNNVLYSDNLIHEYSFLVDSNLNLSYDYNMFLRSNGMINNQGIKTIFQGIEKTIAHIKDYNYAKCSLNSHKDIHNYEDRFTQTDEESFEHDGMNNSSFRE